MPAKSFLVLRGNTYHARLDVPKDVRRQLGDKKVFSASLKTSDLSKAKAMGAYLVSQWRKQILDARSGSDSESWKLEAFDLMMKYREAYVLRGDLDGGEDLSDMLVGQEKILNEVLARYFPRLSDKSKRQIFSETTNAKFYGTPPKVDMFCDALLSKFKAARLNEVETPTAERDVADMKSLGAFLDAADFGFDIRSIHLWLESLPVQRIVKKRKVTAGKLYIKFLQSISQFPNSVDNPFTKVELPKDKKGATKRRQGWTGAEVCALFDRAAGNDQLLASTIAIAAYTGMRAEEISQIKVDDLFKESGDWFLKIHRESTKTDAGERVVPIHKKLLPLVLALKETTSTDYLLDYESYSRIGKRSTLLVTRFSVMKRAMNYPSTKTFHSFRHGLVTLLERAKVQENMAADIVGHVKSTITYGLYSGGSALKERAKARRLQGLSATRLLN